FSDDGIQTAMFGGPPGEAATGVALQANGKIVVGGAGGPGADLIVTRLNPDGEFDQFGTGTFQAIHFSAAAGGRAVALRSDGNVDVVGTPRANNDRAGARPLGDPPDQGGGPALPPADHPPAGGGPGGGGDETSYCGGQPVTIVLTDANEKAEGTAGD